MSKLSAGQRNALPKSTFGLPATRGYPMPDRSHAVFAKAMATKEHAAGRLSSGQLVAIHAKANAVIARG